MGAPARYFIHGRQIAGFINFKKLNVSNALIDRLPEGYSKQLLQSIFSSVSEVDEIIKYLNDIINLLAVRIEKSNDAEANYKMFQLEYLYNFSTQLNRLTDAMQIDGIEMNQITFWNMLMQILNNASVVLTGEPLKGLQVMGLLETRNLDFENVFILSMNEAKMPKGAASLSYIPYSLRKAFGLPTSNVLTCCRKPFKIVACASWPTPAVTFKFVNRTSAPETPSRSTT